MNYDVAKTKLLESEEVRKEYERLQRIKCSKCKHYRGIYIHPWSNDVPEYLKGSQKGFACLLPCDEKFMKSFNQDLYTPADLRVDVMIGREDSVGCENFEEAT